MPWSPAPHPTSWGLFVDNLQRIAAAGATAFAGVVHPVIATRKVVALVRVMQESLGQEPAPATSANQRIGDDRLVSLLRNRLDVFKASAHAHHGTVNDALMTVIAGGYRSLLVSRGELVDDVVLRASVPVSLHAEDSADQVGNNDGMLFVPLPIGIEDTVRRLETIAAATAELKRNVHPAPAGLLLSMRVVQDAFWRRFDHQRWSNAYAANVPGPPLRLYLAGAPVCEVFAIVPIMGNLTIGVGAISYDGQFNITVVADKDTCPDVDVFVDGMRNAIATLTANVEVSALQGSG